MSFRIAVKQSGPGERARWEWGVAAGATIFDPAMEFEDRQSAEATRDSWGEREIEIVEGPPFNLPAVPRTLPPAESYSQRRPAAPAMLSQRHLTVCGATNRKRDLCLTTYGYPPDFPTTDDVLERNKAFFSGEARKIVDALQDTMPGGLVDAILGELCRRKASALVVVDPFGRTMEGIES